MVKLKFKIVKLSQTYKDILMLWQKIVKDGFKPDLIVAILRGGYFPAKILSELFGGINLKTVEISFYKNLERENKPKIIQPIYGSLKGKNVLLVDDVVDSGETLRLAYKHLLKKEVFTAKTAAIHKKVWSRINPDYYVHEIDWWVVYPWELIEFSMVIGRKLKKEGKNLRETSVFLLKKGLNLDGKVVKKVLKEIVF